MLLYQMKVRVMGMGLLLRMNGGDGDDDEVVENRKKSKSFLQSKNSWSEVLEVVVSDGI